jgi:membrane protein DedA with SNARE-associated domain
LAPQLPAFPLQWIAEYGYAGLFLALMFGIAGLPIPDETIMVFCGYLISQHRMEPLPTYVVGLCGSICGISLSYFIGRTGGAAVIERYGKFVHLTPRRVALVNRWFHRSGEWLLTFGYFILGVRHFTALVAGMSGLEFRVFAGYAYFGAAIWVATFLGIGYLVGEHWQQAVEAVRQYSWLLAVLLVLGGLSWWLVVHRRSSQRE